MENPDVDMLDFFEYLVKHAKISLDHTPELLPVLKEVGVVDSGGYGYLTVLEGFLAALKGETIDRMSEEEQENQVSDMIEHEEFGYCTEFILRLEDDKASLFDENKF